MLQWDPQGLWGQLATLLGPPLCLWLCCAGTFPWCQSFIWTRTPLTRHQHWQLSSLLYNVTRSCSWQGWPPINDSWHPYLLWLICWPVEVLVKLLDHSPVESAELQFVSWIMHLSLGQALAGIGDDGISPIIVGLVEDGPKPRSTSTSV